ncbi:NADPH:quinone reductase [Azospirillum sp. TSH7]|uniref:zinc-binding alcohol dehydrogenase family protein n=1 Tax=unclassified Azospirillum TaxID=2630922 RepID=UPI000D604817|nr:MULTISPECIES: zinc-binding alcohol dehydrogenase family protein [unclassified Azospirillum]PWC69600.1 NADPH:quinone reductase [Azospirillum sp. TSH7]PWC69849.1 NADPH:quinone reductase [Azospirillum sp. TSH20]
MKAIGYRKSLPITDADALIDVEIDRPAAAGRDLLVRVEAVSVNPVDTKLRRNASPAEGDLRILGFDAAGIVEAVGPDVTLFRPGDAVFYAGAIDRPGTNSEYHLVDERIVGVRPASLSVAEAAALPLTAITAWEMLFDRLSLPRDASEKNNGEGKSLLIVGGAGGVGSIAIQLARRLSKVRVLATASRPETADWVRELGAHDVIDHSRPMAEQVKALGLSGVDYVFSTNATDHHFQDLVELVAPQGHIGLIDDPEPIDVRLLKRKSVSLHWELMFTRSLFQTADMIAQHELLTEVSRLVDAGTLRTTLTETLGRIDAATLRKAHALIESGKARGKVVLEGF